MPETEIYNDEVDYSFRLYSSALTFENCDFGDSLLLGDENVTLIGSNEYPLGDSTEEPTEEPTEESVGAEGSIFSEGSLPMLAAMSALVISIASLAVAFASCSCRLLQKSCSRFGNPKRKRS